jgi:multiple sugar transport system substrate-binding protein
MNLFNPRTFCVCALLLAGCTGDKPPAGSDAVSANPELPWQGVKVRLLVVGDPRLAKSTGRLRGEWQAATGAELQIAEAAEGDLIDGKLPEVDALLYPAYDMGVLVERGLLRPLPDSELSNSEIAWEEIFESDKTHDASWGSTAYGFPFGSPTLVCCYRKDLLEKLSRQPPRTWPEYEELASLLADRQRLGDSAPAGETPWSGTLEPLAGGWAGLMLLARAAPYAKHRNHYSTLFDMESMEPLVAGPPFVRALDELLAAKRHSSADSLEVSPERAHEALLEGRCGMAITWTSAAFAEAADKPANEPELDLGFAALPGSEQAFNPKTEQWDARREEESAQVPLVGISGRLGSVTKNCSQPDAAFHLLGWLSGPQWSGRVSTASGDTMLFRHAHVKSSLEWTDPRLSALAALNYAEVVEQSLGAADFFGAPRVAGRGRYLSALDEAVRAAAGGKQTSEAALEQAADAWRKITAELGMEKQRAAYRRSLGLQ